MAQAILPYFYRIDSYAEVDAEGAARAALDALAENVSDGMVEAASAAYASLAHDEPIREAIRTALEKAKEEAKK